MLRFIATILLLSTFVEAFLPSHFGVKKSVSTSLGVIGNDSFDMEELRQRIHMDSNPEFPFYTTEWEKRPKPDVVNIIFFNPDTVEEGIHTVEFPQGSGNNVILAFESMKECGIFAAMLQKQENGFQAPSPQQVDLSTLENYSEMLGVYVQVVPKGMELQPPTRKVAEFGHNPYLKDEKQHLDYIFQMVDFDDADAMEMDDAPTVGAWE